MLIDKDVIMLVRFPAKWEHINPLRTFISGYAESVIGKEGGADTSMVANELLENAVKYGDVVSLIDFEARHDQANAGITLRVMNNAQASRITLLQREFKRHLDARDGEAFSQAVTRSVQMSSGVSMLGLARVMSRADLALSVTGNRVTMTARVERFRESPSRRRMRASSNLMDRFPDRTRGSGS